MASKSAIKAAPIRARRRGRAGQPRGEPRERHQFTVSPTSSARGSRRRAGATDTGSGGCHRGAERQRWRAARESPGLLGDPDGRERGADVLTVALPGPPGSIIHCQSQILERVEDRQRLGARAVDIGTVSANTASRWLSSGMWPLVAEYHRRMVSERTAGEAASGSQRRGPFPTSRSTSSAARTVRVEPRRKVKSWSRGDSDAAAESIKAVPDFLRRRGVKVSYHGTQAC